MSGYRYLGFQEGLWLEEHLTVRDPGGDVQIGTTIELFDQFRTANHFHGGTLGLLTRFDRGLVTLEIATKLGVGGVWRERLVDGRTEVRTPTGGEAAMSGGLLALPSNMGSYRDSTFALLPELGVTGQVQLTERLSLNLGYQLMFLTNVYRTGKQVDRTVSTSQLSPVLPAIHSADGGATRPVASLDSSTLRAHGLTAGLQLTY